MHTYYIIIILQCHGLENLNFEKKLIYLYMYVRDDPL